MFATWSLRSRVTVHPSSSSEFHISPVTAPPEIRRWPVILIRPGEAIPFGRPYRIHLNEPHQHPSSSSSSSDSLPVHSSGLNVPDQTHSRSLARDVPPRLCYPLRRAPRCSEAFRVVGIMVMGIDVSDHVCDDPMDVRDDTKEYEADTSAGDTVEVGIDPMSALIVEEEIVEPAGDDSFDSFGTRDDIVRSFEDMPIDLNDVVCDFYHHMSEVRIDRIFEIETVQRRLEVDQLMARGQRVGMIERIDSLRLENLKVRAMLDIKKDRVNSLRLYMSLS
ncbi:hypothetical protein Tco_1314681 [Tanacetum coccineum]